jgi:Rod binding domain-containing protein
MNPIDTSAVYLDNKAIQAPSLSHAASPKKVDRASPLYAQCREFESIFVNMMLKEMRASVDKSDSLIDGGYAEDIFEDMLYENYASEIVKASSFGLADQVYLQLVNSK